MYMKNAKLWADAYYESEQHTWVGAFLGCMYHGYPTCYDKQTFSTMLNKTMGDLYCETERWMERVNTCGNMYSIMSVGSDWQTDVEVRGHVDSYSLADVLNPRDALCGGRCETFTLHDQSTHSSLAFSTLTTS